MVWLDGVVEYVNKYFIVPNIKYNGAINLQTYKRTTDNIDDKALLLDTSLQCHKNISNDRYTI